MLYSLGISVSHALNTSFFNTRAMQIGTSDILCLFFLCLWIFMSVFLFEYSREFSLSSS